MIGILSSDKKAAEVKEYNQDFQYFNWLQHAQIFTKKFTRIPTSWFSKNASIIVLYFSMKNVDKDGVIRNFYEYYEDSKYFFYPLEVINVPLDDNLEDAVTSFYDQANWFTLRYSDELIHILKYYYEVTSVPKLIALKNDGAIMSTQGVADLEVYGRNALITWLGSSQVNQREWEDDFMYYEREWRYRTKDYTRRASRFANPEEIMLQKLSEMQEDMQNQEEDPNQTQEQQQGS